MEYRVINTHKFLVIIMIATISACSNVGYLNNNDVKSLSRTDNIKNDHSIKTSGAPKKLGAIALFKKDENGSVKKDRVFMIARHKSKIGAETMLFDNSKVKEKLFQQSYFSLEADKKKKILGMRLRFTY